MEARFRLPHIWHQPRGTRAFAGYQCNSCGFGSLFPRASPDELRSYYDNDNYFERHDSKSREQYQGQIERIPEPTFLDRLRVRLAWQFDQSQPLDAALVNDTIGISSPKICDIGCATGHLSVKLKALGHRVIGIEPSEDARRRAIAKGLDVVAGYAEALPDEVKGQFFDGVIMGMVLDSCSNPFEALRNAVGLLDRGGYLFVTVPNCSALLSRRLGPPWFHGDAGRHLSFFTPKSLASAVEQSGLKVTRVFYTGYVAAFTNERTAAEERAWDLLYAAETQPFLGQTPKNSRRRQWGTLARTFLASRINKYELVGVIAQRS